MLRANRRCIKCRKREVMDITCVCDTCMGRKIQQESRRSVRGNRYDDNNDGISLSTVVLASTLFDNSSSDYSSSSNSDSGSSFGGFDSGDSGGGGCGGDF